MGSKVTCSSLSLSVCILLLCIPCYVITAHISGTALDYPSFHPQCLAPWITISYQKQEYSVNLLFGWINESMNVNSLMNLLQKLLLSINFLNFFSGKIDHIKFIRVIQLDNPVKARFQSFLNLDLYGISSENCFIKSQCSKGFQNDPILTFH